ncbi:hypothetical protein LTR05_007541 [Lithohypha guttulata]|uniref:Uncharacterized protein n=1 Tax=Lithohypha guttulata TaxID=1690604 RepID=A0AAN7SVA0_9EURO|nr:hypothetical protein LTR05_007541 [Lithohypha guttulata]
MATFHMQERLPMSTPNDNGDSAVSWRTLYVNLDILLGLNLGSRDRRDGNNVVDASSLCASRCRIYTGGDVADLGLVELASIRKSRSISRNRVGVVSRDDKNGTWNLPNPFD